MLNVYLRNPQTDAGVWLNFPASYQTVQHLFSVLGDTPLEIAAAETSVDDLHAHLKGKFFDTEKSRYELDFLNRRIEGLTNQEKDILTAALNIEKPLSIMEIVNLSCNLDKFRLWEGVQDTKQLGQAVIQREQELSKAFAMLLDEEQIGQAYQDSHAGSFSESGYVMRTGEALQVIYEGHSLPEPDYDRDAVFQLRLYTSAYADTHPNTYSLSLPASEEKLELARENLQVDDLNAASIISLHSPKTSLENFLPVSYQIEDLNAFSYQLQKIRIADSESKLEKLKAALCAEMPDTLQEIMEITENLHQYQILALDDIKTAKDYAFYVMDHDPDAAMELEEFINYEGYGKCRMALDGVTQTAYGYVLREDRPIRRLSEELEQINLFSPLTAELYPKDDMDNIEYDSQTMTPSDLCRYEDQIQKQILKEYMESEGDRGLAAYLDNQLLARKIRCMNPTVESWHGELWGVLEVQSYGSLSEKELEAVKEYWCGQESDGWGEGFEQRPIQTPEGELYVSFWNSGNDFFIATEEQLKGLEQESGMQMGGM
ncbi:DUF6329 domain-containing protein [Enterocloster clostridioformis]|uniref:Antirestriction protein (ArdA) n=1 Tax=Enterocloster clostridioformis TaxID=1531 RepID=A0A1I0JJZ4_9FIRM|nr:DUF6329 domain-containing protein [Enterocloster clostridioformis]SEU09968.1 hypothetical protein SAMN05216521_105820 [Enterocloster clostridioformis]SEW46458.1 hypothetical protein SAMN05216528_105719 [Enterocloster clostridioformis]